MWREKLTIGINQQVEEEINSPFKIRGMYNRWTREERLQIHEACTRMGPAKAARELSQQLGKKLSVSTVRSIHKSYS